MAENFKVSLQSVIDEFKLEAIYVHKDANELMIDENDVQASHAMSIGRVDEDQLYYMMSRGLSVQQCTSLISTGYLMPITKVIENEELRNMLAEEMERKIAELCSM